MVTTDPTATRPGRAPGRRHRSVAGLPPNIFPENGVVELSEAEVAARAAIGAEAPDEAAYDIDDDGAADFGGQAEEQTAATEEPAQATNAAGHKLITEGNPDETARIPLQEQFAEANFVADTQLDQIAAALQDKRGLPTKDVRIVYRFKSVGGMKAGKPKTGDCVKLSGPAKHFADEHFGDSVDYLIWIAADHARDYKLSNFQLEALLYHQLLHLAVEENEDGDLNKTVRGHDAEFFLKEFQFYGAWQFDLEQVEKAVKVRQTSLF